MPHGHGTDNSALRLQLLVLRCQAGDERAFSALMEDFGPRTHRYLRGLLGDEADDVLQDVWLSVYRSLATLANPAGFRTWLFSTTRRRAIDHLRRRRRHETLLHDIMAESTAAADVDTDDESSAELDAEHLDGVLNELPIAQREVLLLRFRDDMSYSEIAVITGCPLGTVKTRIHHARRNLRRLLERGAI
jgi:RNA polymerase sigma-70 factor (ECF subfamily)